MFEKSCEFIYDMLSRRIKARKNFLQLTYNEICPPAGSNLICAIAHNRRHAKKNPYLIPDGTKGSYISSNNKPFIEIISSNLNFNSPIELIIGTDAEQKKYAGFLFRQLLLDGLEEEELTESIEALLDDYIPYAQKHFFIDVVSKDGIVSEMIDDKYHIDIEDVYLEREYSIARLFKIHKELFLDTLKEIFNTQQSTIKLDKKLYSFLSSVLIPTMNKNRNAYYLSISTKKMLDEIQSLWKSSVEHELLLETVYHWNGHYEDDADNSSVISSLITANIDYIDNLAKIQLQAEGRPDVNVFINLWHPEMCLDSF